MTSTARAAWLVALAAVAGCTDAGVLPGSFEEPAPGEQPESPWDLVVDPAGPPEAGQDSEERDICTPDSGFQFCYSGQGGPVYAELHLDAQSPNNPVNVSGHWVLHAQSYMRVRCNVHLYKDSTSCSSSGCNGTHVGYDGTFTVVQDTAYSTGGDSGDYTCWNESGGWWAWAAGEVTLNTQVVHCYEDSHCGSDQFCDISGAPSTWACAACPCTSGACCDGCQYRGASTVCAADVDDEQGCGFGAGCGDDVTTRTRDLYCSGASAACDGAWGPWSGWALQTDCGDEQLCVEAATTASCQTDAQCICSCPDADGDGHFSTSCTDPLCSPQTDCDDTRASCALDCTDADADAIPDCGDDCLDHDGDGYGDDTAFGACSGPDCAPYDPAIHPGAAESCDAVDSDCDGDLVDGFADVDADGEPDCVDPCVDADGDGLGDGTAGNAGCELTITDSDDADPLACLDADGDGCDDCSQGDGPDVSDDGPDADDDGVCDATDPDDDGDCFTDAQEATCGTDPQLASSVPVDLDGDCSCDLVDPCVDVDGDGVGVGMNGNLTCAVLVIDLDDAQPTVCADVDGDGCDDCTSGAWAPAADGLDTDGDGACDVGDVCTDADGDGLGDGSNGNVGCPGGAATDLDDGDLLSCGDGDGDGCDDCSQGVGVDPAADGLDTDGDGACDAGDPDDDGDCFPDADEVACATDPLLSASAPTDSDGDCWCDLLDDCVDDDGDGLGDGSNGNSGCADPAVDSDVASPGVCGDEDGDACDDCASGTWDPSDDGPDADVDGICDASDECVDADGDGLGDGTNGNTDCIAGASVDTDDGDALLCGDSDGDLCDDCSQGVGVDPSDDGADTDGDGACDASDPDDDGDCFPDADEAACGTDSLAPSSVPADADGDCSCDQLDPCVDADGDGFGDGTNGNAGCFEAAVDTDDGSTSICADLDDDLCDDCSSGSFDPSSDGADLDGDGLCDVGDPDADGDGDPFATDCDDADDAVYSSAPESCDALDSDCDGDLVDGDLDTDGDGQPDCIEDDSDGDGELDVHDCAPLDASVHSGAEDVPDDGIDNDCSGAGTVTCWQDDDGDGAGGMIEVLEVDGDCDEPGLVEQDDDCDDADPASYPGAPELCDDVDNDCDEDVDEELAFLHWYEDADGDGFGDPDAPWADNPSCEEPEGYVADDGDCDDDDPLLAPDAQELCDGIDNDCDPGTDLDGQDVDADADGHLACDDDCDDDDPTAHPDAGEVCGDDVDQDCDGAEAAVGADPQCLRTGCSGCSGAASGGARVGWLSVLLLLGLARRRGRSSSSR